MREQIREALVNWGLATRFANEHEAEMWAAVDRKQFHIGWLLVHDGHEHLSMLAEQCMTAAQRRAPYRPPLDAMLIDRPKAQA